MTNPPDVLGSVEETLLRTPWRSVPVRTYDGKTVCRNLGQTCFVSFLGQNRFVYFWVEVILFISGRSFRGRQGSSWAGDKEKVADEEF